MRKPLGFMFHFCHRSYLIIGSRWLSSVFALLQVKTDPRRLLPLIDYLRSLASPSIVSNPFLEITAWSLIQKLNAFQWRIPSVWREISAQAKELFDHPSKIIRERIVRCVELERHPLTNVLCLLLSVVVASLAYDIKFPNDQSKRHPTIDEFFGSIADRFHQAVQIYKTAQSGKKNQSFVLGV